MFRQHIIKAIAFFCLLSLACFAQDTLVWKNKTRTVVSITDMYEDQLFYTKTTDSLPHSCHLSKLSCILYKDGSKRDLQELYTEASDSLSPEPQSPVLPSRNMELYRKGVEDAKTHYTFKDHWLKRRSHSKEDKQVYFGIFTKFWISNFSERDIEYPDNVLEKDPDYRSGYREEYLLRRSKFQLAARGVAIGAALIVLATFIL